MEFLNYLEISGLPFHILTLKIGAPIMLLRNINPPQLFKGTRLFVKALDNNMIKATILTGCGKGVDIYLPRIAKFSDIPYIFERLQFMVKLAFSFTINKSQGLSLKTTGLLLDTPCFDHGQKWVDPKNLYIYCENGKTMNIIYQQALK
jgi:ATP-dependent DNA helicase PIF1